MLWGKVAEQAGNQQLALITYRYSAHETISSPLVHKRQARGVLSDKYL